MKEDLITRGLLSVLTGAIIISASLTPSIIGIIQNAIIGLGLGWFNHKHQ